MCFSKPALDGPTLRLLLDSLPGHFETLETLRLRTTTDDEEQLLALASLLSPEVRGHLLSAFPHPGR